MIKYAPYPKQMALHRAGLEYRHRLLTQANCVGGSLACAAEVAMHAMQEYPAWWPGYKFTTQPTILLVAPDLDLVRWMMDRPLKRFTGSFRFPHFYSTFEDAVDKETGRLKPDIRCDVLWMEQEPMKDGKVWPRPHQELLSGVRIPGISLMNFCPLNGLSDVVRHYQISPNATLITMSWTDAPHLPDNWGDKFLAQRQIEARQTGEA